MRKILSTALAVATVLAGMTVPVSAETLNATLAVNESVVLKEADKTMFGFNTDSNWQTENAAAYGVSGNSRPELKEALDKYGFKVPMLRAFLYYKNLNWKDLVGPVDDRTGDSYSRIYTYGLVEWIKGMKELNEDIEFVFAVNVDDSEENLADLIRFLTLTPGDENAIGSDDINWPAKRIEYGLVEPVKIRCIELGNEYDNQCYAVTEDNPTGAAGPQYDYDLEKRDHYVARCNAIIPAMRAVNPDVKLSVVASSQPSAGIKGTENYFQWNGKIIPELGPKADYVVVHYYPTDDLSNFGYFWDYERLGYQVEKFINELPAEDRPQVFISEYALWRDLNDVQDPELRDRWSDMHAALIMGELLNRFNNQTSVGLAAHHTFMAGASTKDSYSQHWGVLRPFDGGDYVLSPSGEYYKMATDAAEGVIVESTLGGNDYATWKTTDLGDSAGVYNGVPGKKKITSTAFLQEDGSLNLLLVNRNAEITQNINFTSLAGREYCLESETVLNSENVRDTNNYDNDHLVYAKTNAFSGNETFTSYAVTPETVAVLKLRPKNTAFGGQTNIEVKLDGKAVKGGNAQVEQNKSFGVFCTLLRNGQAADADSVFMTITDEYGNLCYFNEQGNINRARTAFDVILSDVGEYTMTLKSGAASETVILDCRTAQPEPVAEILTADAKGISAVICDEEVLGKMATVEVQNAISGEICYWDTAVAKRTMTAKYEMPKWAPSGEYNVIITVDGKTAQKTFTYGKNEKVGIVSLQKTDGSRVTVESLLQADTVEIMLKSQSANGFETDVTVAFYDENGRLVQSAMAKGTAEEGGTKVTITVPELPETAKHAKMFIWESGVMSPLTDIYLIAEKEGER